MKHLTVFASAACAVATFSLSAQDAAAPDTAWKSQANLNAAVNKGNSDTLLIGANILTERKWDKNEFFAGADVVYGENKDTVTDIRTTTAQNYGAFLQYNRLLSDRWYFLGRADGRQDKVADIKYRVTLSPGVGYYFIKKEKTTLTGEVGPGVVFEQFDGGPSQTYFTVRLAERFTHEFNERVRLVQQADFTPQVDDLDNYVFNFLATLSADLTKGLQANLTLSDTYRGEPAPGRKANDIRILAGLGYKF
jgi:putative salt-induced outer membrane protein